MATSFHRSTRSLVADAGRGWRTLSWLCVAVLLLGVWAVWSVQSRVTVWAQSTRARVEVDEQVHPVAVPVSGRVEASRLVLGDWVNAGDVLVELDAEGERHRLNAEQRRFEGLAPQMEAIQRQIAAEEGALNAEHQATQSVLEIARARAAESEAEALLAEDQAQRWNRLGDSGGVSELDLIRTKKEAERRRAAAQAVALDGARLQRDQRVRDGKARARIEDLRRELAELNAQAGTTRAAIELLEHELDRRLVRAPITGKVGGIAQLQKGTVLREGDRVATIVPPGALRVVAEFSKEAALGRLRPGQQARVRLDGFPWLQYGSLSGRVERVASEPHEELVRVELAVSSSDRIRIEHGLSGIAEIEIEQVSPAVLLLRSIGEGLERRPVAVPEVPVLGQSAR